MDILIFGKTAHLPKTYSVCIFFRSLPFSVSWILIENKHLFRIIKIFACNMCMLIVYQFSYKYLGGSQAIFVFSRCIQQYTTITQYLYQASAYCLSIRFLFIQNSSIRSSCLMVELYDRLHVCRLFGLFVAKLCVKGIFSFSMYLMKRKRYDFYFHRI